VHRNPRTLLFAAAALVTAWALPHSAYAWTCGRVLDNSGTASGSGLFWPTRNLTYSFNTAGTTMLDNEAAKDAIRAAFGVWQESQLRTSELSGCPGTAVATLPTSTDLTFSEGAVSDQNYVGYNYLNPTANRNMILFRDSHWPHLLTAPTSDLIGLTTVTYNVLTGEILDADIEINTDDFNLTVGDSNVAFDLLNTAVHEVGHFLGFADSDVTTATMFSQTRRQETTKRQLSCDDAAILWFRYPTGLPTTTCKASRVDESCGFCAAPGGLAYKPTIKLQDSYDGHSGCSCHSSQGAVGAGSALAALLLRRFRRWLKGSANANRRNLAE
jgi:hypothetical protein